LKRNLELRPELESTSTKKSRKGLTLWAHSKKKLNYADLKATNTSSKDRWRSKICSPHRTRALWKTIVLSCSFKGNQFSWEMHVCDYGCNGDPIFHECSQSCWQRLSSKDKIGCCNCAWLWHICVMVHQSDKSRHKSSDWVSTPYLVEIWIRKWHPPTVVVSSVGQWSWQQE
jgi:hypothetical protein